MQADCQAHVQAPCRLPAGLVESAFWTCTWELTCLAEEHMAVVDFSLGKLLHLSLRQVCATHVYQSHWQTCSRVSCLLPAFAMLDLQGMQ